MQLDVIAVVVFVEERLDNFDRAVAFETKDAFAEGRLDSVGLVGFYGLSTAAMQEV